MVALRKRQKIILHKAVPRVRDAWTPSVVKFLPERSRAFNVFDWRPYVSREVRVVLRDGKAALGVLNYHGVEAETNPAYYARLVQFGTDAILSVVGPMGFKQQFLATEVGVIFYAATPLEEVVQPA